MKKEIQFSLVYRDMWQSSGRYVPRKDQLARVAPVIIDMGCFDRVETNGGASEQVNLLYGENPNQAVRTFCKPFNEAGIKTHMLDRGLNALRMNPVPADVRQLMYKVKHAQGTDITRNFVIVLSLFLLPRQERDCHPVCDAPPRSRPASADADCLLAESRPNDDGCFLY